jgi:ribonuclease BN (tRNA processing enzyme)
MIKDWYEMKVTPALHSDETTVGFKLNLDSGVVSYTSDTQYFDKLVDAHKGARVLIACLTRPLNGKIPYHMSTEEVATLVKKVQPELAILTHLGLRVIGDSNTQANWISEESGIPTIAAFDGMRVYMEEKIEIKRD